MKRQRELETSRMNWSVLLSLAALILVIMLAPPASAAPIDPPHPQQVVLGGSSCNSCAATLWDCANGPAAPGGDCSAVQGGPTDHGWNKTGNIGSTSHYTYGDVIPWRVELTGLPSTNPTTITVTLTYAFVNGSGFAFDYMDDWNVTVAGDPCFGTSLQGACGGTGSTLTEPIDPRLNAAAGGTTPGTTCPATNPLFHQPSGVMNGYGGITITSIQYVGTHTCDATQNSDATIQVVFTTTGASDAVLVFGLHSGRVFDWGAVPSQTQSPYHAALATWLVNGSDPGGLQTTQLQLKMTGATTAVTLSSFQSRPDVEKMSSQVTLNWTTAAELNTAGFNLYRSASLGGEYVRLNMELIPALNAAVFGGNYTFTDATAAPDQAYYYRLEEVELAGTVTQHAPIFIPARTALASAR